MDLGIRGRRALILGGSRGIGRAVAGTLAAEGANLAVCARKGWAARRVASEAAGGWGVEAAGYCIDAWDESSAAALVDRITGELGAVDLLFGVARRPALEDRHRLSWKERLDDGFLRFRATTETLLSGMKDRQWGRVLWMIPWPAPGTSAERQLHSVTGAGAVGVAGNRGGGGRRGQRRLERAETGAGVANLGERPVRRLPCASRGLPASAHGRIAFRTRGGGGSRLPAQRPGGRAVRQDHRARPRRRFRATRAGGGATMDPPGLSSPVPAPSWRSRSSWRTRRRRNPWRT